MPATKRKTRAIVTRRKPSSHAIVKREVPTVAEAVERVLIQGDLSPLQPAERVQYYKAVCKSLNLNPLTSPFMYILFREAGGSEKLQLYATKSCAEQLRKLHGVSVLASRKEIADAICMYEVDVRDRTGRTDSAAGAVPLYKFKDGKRIDLIGVEWCNAVMKSHTKAKRRATLSICGLAFLDESELDTMQVIGGVTPDGRIFRHEPKDAPTPREQAQDIATKKIAELSGKAEEPKSVAKQPIVRKVEVRTIQGDEFAVTGFLEDIQMERFLSDTAAKKFEAKEDKRLWWRMEDRYRTDFDKLCKKLELEVVQ